CLRLLFSAARCCDHCTTYFAPVTLFCVSCSFFLNDAATTVIYTLSLHDALPICDECGEFVCRCAVEGRRGEDVARPIRRLLNQVDRKSTRLNSSHVSISYAVFCLKKKRAEDATHENSTN